MAISIICTCGKSCTRQGVRVVPYTMWSRWDAKLKLNTYERTCGFCGTPAKRAQLTADGYTEHAHFATS